MKTSLYIILFLITATCTQCVKNAYTQGKTISGLIKSKDGEGLPGVTVLIKGTTVGTSTNIDGSFSLASPINKPILTISFVGYTAPSVDINKNETKFKLGGINLFLTKFWCCTNHAAPNGPHCDINKEKLKNEFGCKNFSIK